MLIREARLSDATALLPLLRQLGYAKLDESEIREKVRLYSAAPNRLLVSENETSVTSFIALHIFPLFHSPGNAGRIIAFCVDEQFRSQGIGVKMLKAAEDYFLANGCARVEVTSNNRRTDAHAFYLHQGYLGDSRKFVKYF